VPNAPRSDEWVDWVPPFPGETQGVAVLSRKAALWVNDVLGILRVEKGLRGVEHDCLDKLEKKGLITQ